MSEPQNKRVLAVACIFLGVSTAVAYLPVLKADFINCDDPQYVTANPHVMLGLSLESIRWAFTSAHFFMWHPMTSLSHMLDCQLFGLRAGWHHLTNLIFHITSVLLLFTVLRRMTGTFWQSAFVAAVFALHPLNVESVAWVCERKNLLSTFFWMLTIAAYVRYAKDLRTLNYLLVIFIFSLGLMSKPTVVTLPFVLLLLDYWPLCRFQWIKQDSPVFGYKKLSTWRLVTEKIPLLILSAILCIITVAAQTSGGVLKSNEAVSFGARLTNALVSYVTYIGKMIYPAHLAVFYPYPRHALPIWEPIVSFLALAIISAGLIYLARRRAYLAVGWLWYLGTLVPVIGLIQAGSQATADRYAYVPLIGLFIMIAWGTSDLTARWRYPKPFLGILAPAIVLILAVLTRHQAGYWHDSIALFQHAVNVTTNNDIACNNLGIALLEKGQLDAALANFQTTLRFRPKDAKANYNVAVTLAKQGKTDEADVYYNKALSLNPGDPLTCISLATAKVRQGRFTDAIAFCREGLKHYPENEELHSYLGFVLMQMDKIDEAIGELETAVKLGGDSMAYSSLASAVLSKGRYDSAIEYYNKAIRFDPKNPDTYYNLATVLLEMNQFDKAAIEYEQAIRLNPRHAKAYGNLAVVMVRQNRFAEAIKNFTKVAELEPNSATAHFNLATALLKNGQIDKAADQYRKVLSLDPNDIEARKRLEAMTAAQNKPK